MRLLPAWLTIAAALGAGGCCAHNVAVYASIGGDTSYAHVYQGYLQSDLAETFVHVSLGDNSLTAAGLAAAIGEDSAISGALSLASVVTVNVGGRELADARSLYRQRRCGGEDNQDCLRAMIRIFDSYWRDITAGVLRHVQRAATVRTMELHHAWVAVDRVTNTVEDHREAGVRGSDFDVMRDYLHQLNASIRAHAEVWNIGVASAYSALNGPLGIDDPVALGYVDAHSAALTTKGQEQIALALRRLGYAATPEPFTLDGR